MIRVSSLILASAAALAFTAPALAKTTIQSGESLCKAEVAKQHTPKSLKVDKDATKATGAAFVYTIKIKTSEDASSKLKCTIDRESNAIVLAAAE